jgi:hypothetical protein
MDLSKASSEELLNVMYQTYWCKQPYLGVTYNDALKAVKEHFESPLRREVMSDADTQRVVDSIREYVDPIRKELDTLSETVYKLGDRLTQQQNNLSRLRDKMNLGFVSVLKEPT